MWAILLEERRGTQRSWRGFVDKTEARLAPGIVQLYAELQIVASTASMFAEPK
jgi:hypothetical protein